MLGCLMALVALAGAFVIVGGVIALFSGNAIAGLIAVAIGATPLIILRQNNKREIARREGIRIAMRTAAGLTSGTKWEHMEGDSGLAINLEARELTLVAGGKIKTYALADVRGWTARIVKAGQTVVVGGGLAGGAMMGAGNIGEAIRASADTGLFVTVRDIDYPEWRIQMADAKIQARWMEILEQVINEGRTTS